MTGEALSWGSWLSHAALSQACTSPTAESPICLARWHFQFYLTFLTLISALELKSEQAQSKNGFRICRLWKTASSKFLAGFKRRLKPHEQAKFAFTTLNDLELATKDLQEKQKKSKTAQNLTRIQPFLQAMMQYKEIIEVYLNASSMLCFIWGPMKFMLLVSFD